MPLQLGLPDAENRNEAGSPRAKDLLADHRIAFTVTVAITVSVGRLRKMSPTPQIPKVRIRRANRPLTMKDPALERIAWSIGTDGRCVGGEAG